MPNLNRQRFNSYNEFNRKHRTGRRPSGNWSNNTPARCSGAPSGSLAPPRMPKRSYRMCSSGCSDRSSGFGPSSRSSTGCSQSRRTRRAIFSGPASGRPGDGPNTAIFSGHRFPALDQPTTAEVLFSSERWALLIQPRAWRLCCVFSKSRPIRKSLRNSVWANRPSRCGCAGDSSNFAKDCQRTLDDIQKRKQRAMGAGSSKSARSAHNSRAPSEADASRSGDESCLRFDECSRHRRIQHHSSREGAFVFVDWSADIPNRPR